ncbi:biotin--[acetyl-CoA-carboxylase] ligase [Faecalibacter bovis]|uniref:Biotin--[acetyl-CoA-carboxylase] ligase n=1 Tax=Faecalibacter bovis TaxID=2898187 RepID=A0ABX7XE73_9FLAO|nr:biotin--[acetyl-CoA-carboxylase] ligase [Faecalibacter bovis]MBS7333214.1 biotin--[acetyl-CoA-carboxylase] ligase [Weeksellaceae bacterium]QTV06144.1 biotin--[acetyl-CoA-carboxylase] ligase [Faecalibacter bovis]
MKIITFDTLPNTNDYLSDLSKKDANSWTVIHTYNQTEGRGYAGNKWIEEENKNLTFSLLIKSDLEYMELIYLNQWIANSIYKSLSQFSKGFEIKWPNDIILNGKKICGVLVENSKSKDGMNSVIGIGVNLNQTDFNHLPKATSLANETDKVYDIMTILEHIVLTFKNEYYLIEDKNFDEISSYYNNKLFRKDVISTFIKNGVEVKGIIREATNRGTLIVEIDNERLEFLHKQIELVF